MGKDNIKKDDTGVTGGSDQHEASVLKDDKTGTGNNEKSFFDDSLGGHGDLAYQFMSILKEMKDRLEKIQAVTPFRSFVNGVFAGLGTVVGATLIVALLLWILQQADTVPIIGSYISDIIDVVENRDI